MASTSNKEKVKINDGHYGEMLDWKSYDEIVK